MLPVVFGQSTRDGDKVVVHNSGDRVDTYNLTVDRDALAVSAADDPGLLLPTGTDRLKF